MTETEILQSIRAALNSGPTRLWRNNIAKVCIRGRWIDYGIPGPGGSDLLGLHSITITPEMVGKRVAIFTAIEVKKPGGRIASEQSKFCAFVSDMGGIAGIANSADSAINLITQYES